jgi:cytochrome d ubiquinol oxidase subunit II
MTQETLILLCAASALAGLCAYVVLAGADFGGGVWDLFAFGPRAQRQRDAIAHAMGPVWEANHVWLIFVLVMLFTCFPVGYAVLAVALFVPFHLALAGIMLRGAAFVFRAHGPEKNPPPGEIAHHTINALARPAVWEVFFGAASVVSPFVLGAAFGALTSGAVGVINGNVHIDATRPIPWLTPYPIGCGVLALSTCAYLAAVYLVQETDGDLREDFRRRAILAGTATAALAAVVLVLAYREAHWFYERLLSRKAWPLIAAGIFFFGASAWAVFTRRYRLGPVFAAGEIVLLLLGWGVAHRRYLIYPDVTLASAAAPASTLRFMLATLPVGLALVLPSLWLLFRVFKRKQRK